MDGLITTSFYVVGTALHDINDSLVGILVNPAEVEVFGVSVLGVPPGHGCTAGPIRFGCAAYKRGRHRNRYTSFLLKGESPF